MGNPKVLTPEYLELVVAGYNPATEKEIARLLLIAEGIGFVYLTVNEKKYLWSIASGPSIVLEKPSRGFRLTESGASFWGQQWLREKFGRIKLAACEFT